MQAAILPVADRHTGYAAEVGVARCGDAGVRCRVDERSESVGKKIHDAEVAKYPYMLVVGDREEAERRCLGSLARRGRTSGAESMRRVRRGAIEREVVRFALGVYTGRR